MNKQWKPKAALVAAGLAVFLAAGAPFASAADIWSQPTYTEQWSTPAYTEQWTVPEATDPWSDSPPAVAEPEPAAAAAEPAVEPAAAATQPAAAAKQIPSLYVKLRLDSNRAFIQNEERLIDVPPVRMNGRTMVPFRLLSELMQAEVNWDPATQVITFISGETTVLLKVGESTALVNGSPVLLDAPPVLSRGRTLVPLRFLAESMNLQVQYTEATQTIEIRDRGATAESAAPGVSGTAFAPGGAGSESGAGSANVPNAGSSGNIGGSGNTGGSANTVNSGNNGGSGNAANFGNNGGSGSAADSSLDVLTNFEALYGDWLIWTPGGATNLYFKDTGNYATHEYTPGAEQGTISIHKNGTFTMKYAIWGDATGKWRLTYPSEINGERLIGIVLEDGAGGYDWAVAPSANGTVRLLSSAGTWADGSSSWLIESELYRE